jgi:hypothetical protein
MALAALCACAKEQESTTDYWMKKNQELASLEDGIRHTRYSINTLIDHEKRMQKRAEEIRKNFPAGRGEA